VTTVEDHLRRRFGLGAIDQISFAVSSVDDARPRYEAMFGGPFTVAWLAQHGEGLHHLRYPVADVVATRAEMEAAGCTAILRDAGDAVFSYLEVPMLNGMVVELISHGVA